jgi:hypothetical protein
MQWMSIPDGTKYDPNRDASDDSKALHVECSADDSPSVTAILRNTHFPLVSSSALYLPGQNAWTRLLSWNTKPS